MERLFFGKNIGNFSREHKLEKSTLWKVLRGELFHTRGWRRDTPENRGIPFNKEKLRINRFTVISPSGDEFESTSLTNFAKEHGLDRHILGDLIRGRRPEYKGWTKAP